MAISDLITSLNTGITNIANAIRSKTGSQSTIPFATLPSAVNDVYDAGQNDFWDCVQKNGTRVDYEYAFNHWSCEYIRPKYKVIPNNYRSIYLFANNPRLKKVESQYFDLSNVKSDTSSATSGHYFTFYRCGNLEEIEDIGMPARYYSGTFRDCVKLHTIAVLRVTETTAFGTVDNYAFRNCLELQNITISGTIGTNGLSFVDCTKLSKASITSVISHLSANASGKSVTFSQTAVENAFTTAEWNTLIGTKTNWTISLS